MTASYTVGDAAKAECLQTHRPDSEMMTSFLTILYQDLLIGEQVDVYTYRSSMGCGTNSLNVPELSCCNSYLRAVLMESARVLGAAESSEGGGKQR